MRTQQLQSSNLWIAAGLLAGLAGALLAVGCDTRTRTDPGDVSAAPVQEDALDPGKTFAAKVDDELAELERRVAEAENGAKHEIDEAREASEGLSVAARERLESAIDRAEDARDKASDRLDELKDSGAAHWEERRQRVVEALGELSEARHEVVSALQDDDENRSAG